MSYRISGYADAKPSETIHKTEIPGLVVSCVFPFVPSGDAMDLPIGQYKRYSEAQKAERCRVLSGWLAEQREQGLHLTAFSSVHRPGDAAKLGLSLVEELPETM